jgi:peptide/nickel transport system permease protein
MLHYVGRRLLLAIPVALGVALGAFVIIHLVPGNPVQSMLGINATPETIAIVEEQLGLDRPLPVQFADFVGGVFRGDLGDSIIRQAPVREVIADRILPSFWLILYAAFISIVVGVPLAVLSAIRRNRTSDHVVRLLTMVGFAIPSFWVGLLLALQFALRWDWFPVAGYGSGVGGVIRSLTLPAITVALLLTPMVVRTLRSSLLDVLDEEYVEAARARGFSEVRTIGRHALRNALIATITVLSVNIGYLIGGTVVVENVFQIPGVGSLIVTAILDRDYPLVQAMTFFFGIAVVLVNLVTDLVYVLVDPRVRLGKA